MYCKEYGDLLVEQSSVWVYPNYFVLVTYNNISVLPENIPIYINGSQIMNPECYL